MSNVVVYTSSTCPYCDSVKEYLNERGVSYTEKNISTDVDARKELMKMGHMGVPVTIVDGEEVVGFNKERLDELLDK